MEALWTAERTKQVEDHLNKLAKESSVAGLSPKERAHRSRAARIALSTIPKTNTKPKLNIKQHGGEEIDESLFDLGDILNPLAALDMPQYGGVGGGGGGAQNGETERSNREPPKPREEVKRQAKEMAFIKANKERELDHFLKEMAVEVHFRLVEIETSTLTTHLDCNFSSFVFYFHWFIDLE